MTLDSIVSGAWGAYQQAVSQNLPVLVRPSIPIAWFGDLEAYLASPLRVITVGLNPSLVEFPIGDPFSRFPKARHLSGRRTLDGDHEHYVAALNEYFRANPYSGWFKPAFESILLGMGSSYYGQAASTALHTDLMSPLATNPTWSRLGTERSVLGAVGIRLWHDLVELLRPNVIVVSMAQAHLGHITFDKGPWRTIHEIETSERRTRPYGVEACTLRISGDHWSVLVFGRAANLPFGTVSSSDKRVIGEAILRAVHAG